MERGGFETSIYKVAIALIILGLGLLSTMFVTSMILSLRKEGASLSISTTDLIGSISKLFPIIIAIAVAFILLSKGLNLLFRLKEFSEAG